MAKDKIIDCEIKRLDFSPRFVRLAVKLGDSQEVTKNFCLFTLRKIAPALCKGLRPGQSRKLVLTQTARGIRLERIEK